MGGGGGWSKEQYRFLLVDLDLRNRCPEEGSIDGITEDERGQVLKTGFTDLG